MCSIIRRKKMNQVYDKMSMMMTPPKKNMTVGKKVGNSNKMVRVVSMGNKPLVKKYM